MANEQEPPFRWLVVQKNSDGRPCAWASSKKSEQDAATYAREIYDRHECYPGEEIGEVEVHKIADEPAKNSEAG